MPKPIDDRQMRAAEAIKTADITAMKQLFDESNHDLEMMFKSVEIMLEHKKLGPMPSDCGINAMKDVALAAIDLAKFVAIQITNGTGNADGT